MFIPNPAVLLLPVLTEPLAVVAEHDDDRVVPDLGFGSQGIEQETDLLIRLADLAVVATVHVNR